MLLFYANVYISVNFQGNLFEITPAPVLPVPSKKKYVTKAD